MDKSRKIIIIFILILVIITISLPFGINWVFGKIITPLPQIMYVGTNETWIGFIGGYLGAIIGILGIWGQIIHAKHLKDEESKEIERKDKLGAVNYYIDILKTLKTNIEKVENYIYDYSGIKNANRIEERNIYNLFLTEIHKKIFVEMFYKLSMEKDLTKILNIFNYVDYFENVLTKNTNFYSEKYETFIELSKLSEKHKNVNEKAKEIYDCICKLDRLELIEMSFVKSKLGPRENRKINFKKKNKIITEVLNLTAKSKKEYFKDYENIMYNLSRIDFNQWELESILNGPSENKNFNLKNYESEINDLLAILNTIKDKFKVT